MANIRFLLQGFTEATHLDEVRRLFDCPDNEVLLLSVAFVNSHGVERLAKEIAESGAKIEVFAGIRNDITSRQGLQRLLELGASVHVVDTGAGNLLFHPKIYFARGSEEARVIVGSANLTLGGLHNNIEASLSIDLDLKARGDRQLAQWVTEPFSSLTRDYPEHVFQVTCSDKLEELEAEGRLLDEAKAFRPRALANKTEATADRLSRIQLKHKPLRPSVRLPSRKTSASKETTVELLWRSKPLTRRDLSLPDSSTTHATGSINLDKGLMEDHIDHRHYFRNEVFAQLAWRTAGPTVDEAYASFSLIVKKIDCGKFRLRVAHTTSTTSVAYLQRNAMTRLSWGPAREYVAQEYLLDRTLSLYREIADHKRFVLEID